MHSFTAWRGEGHSGAGEAHAVLCSNQGGLGEKGSKKKVGICVLHTFVQMYTAQLERYVLPGLQRLAPGKVNGVNL